MSSENKPTFDSEPRYCSIANALDVLGDRWSLLVLREILVGNHRFTAILRTTGAPRDVLTDRLRKLEAAGVIERRVYSQRPPRHEYHVTEAGEAVGPVLRELLTWGERFVTPADRAASARPHRQVSS